MRLLHLDDLSVALPGRTLFDHITWSIFRGERHGLVGPNGAGKTTLLENDGGAVRADGRHGAAQP